MGTEKIDEPNLVDGGTPTDEEARLAAQVDSIGTDPQVDPDDAPTDDATDTTTTTETTDQAATDQAAIAATAEADADAAAAKAAEEAAAQPPAPSPSPGAAPPLSQRPVPPKDFDAEAKAIQQRYEDGEIDGAAMQAAFRELSKEEGRYTAQVTIWEDKQNSAQIAAVSDFNVVALAWEAANKDFMSNTLRRQAMQQAIDQIDKETGGTLSPADLFERAGREAHEAFGYTPPAATPSPSPADAAKAIAAATAARVPQPTPKTLADAPAAANLDQSRSGNYAELDGKSIGELEDALARMTPQQRDAYLNDAPGSASLATTKPPRATDA